MTRALKRGRRPSSRSTPHGDLAVARRVIAAEIDGLKALAARLDGAFERAVETILAAEGRTIVSGMGKSGHVGAKIAATLASTGTPAQFVHPAEASHGDLGMITRADVCLVLSNSGETRELADVIAHCRRHAIPLIGVASNAGSALMKAADVRLVLPKADEACPVGLAPTTSTTMALALGDALAVALMERRGFGREDYKAFHPGGSLGQALMHVAEIMHSGDALPLAREDAPLEDGVAAISAKGFGLVAAVDARGRLTGVVTDGDLRRRMGQDLSRARVADAMTRSPKTVPKDALVAEAIGLMNDKRITALVVVEKGRPVGIVHMHDCLRAGFR